MKATSRSRLEHGESGYQIRGGNFERKVLALGATNAMDIIAGGARFTDCEFRMKRVTGTDFNFDATCVNCDFHLPRRVANRHMDRPVLDGCRFHGHFAGFDFGPKFLSGDIMGPSKGSLRNCDFSNARLHLCAFYETALAAHSWPGWPHIFLDYSEGAAWAHTLAGTPLSERLKIVLRLQTDDMPEEAVRSLRILSVYLPELGEDPEAVWPLIQDVQQIWFPGKESKARAGTEQILAVQRKNANTAEKWKQNQDRLCPFNLMHRCWLQECRSVDSPRGIELVFDSSYLLTRVPDAPRKVRLLLKEGVASLRRATGIEAMQGPVEKYMVMGAVLEGDVVILKPHRKERGQVVVNFATCEMFDENGEPLEDSRLLNYVQRYWRV